MDKPSEARATRAVALIMRGNECMVEGFVLHEPPFRYLATETEEFGDVVEAHQAETVAEIVVFLEASKIRGTDTEIHDLDTGDVLRPDFEHFYRIPRIYRENTVVFCSTGE